jgi:hypothetical protein
MIVGTLTERLRASLHAVLRLTRFPRLLHVWQVSLTFTLVVIAFLFFRAESVSHALEMLFAISRFPFDVSDLLAHWRHYIQTAGVGIGLKGVVLAVLALEILQYYQAKLGRLYLFESVSRVMRWGWYYTLVLALLFFGHFGGQTFIYFQF